MGECETRSGRASTDGRTSLDEPSGGGQGHSNRSSRSGVARDFWGSSTAFLWDFCLRAHSDRPEVVSILQTGIINHGPAASDGGGRRRWESGAAGSCAGGCASCDGCCRGWRCGSSFASPWWTTSYHITSHPITSYQHHIYIPFFFFFFILLGFPSGSIWICLPTPAPFDKMAPYWFEVKKLLEITSRIRQKVCGHLFRTLKDRTHQNVALTWFFCNRYVENSVLGLSSFFLHLQFGPQQGFSPWWRTSHHITFFFFFPRGIFFRIHLNWALLPYTSTKWWHIDLRFRNAVYPVKDLSESVKHLFRILKDGAHQNVAWHGFM